MSMFNTPPESFSRELDLRVQAEEMPYGYTMAPPPADTGNHNERARESHKIEKIRKS
jgi:hypothetical protein